MKLELYIASICTLLIVMPVFVAGQGVIVSSGIYMKMTGGTIVLHGNWVNNGSYSDTNSTIILNDTAQQHIGGSSFTEFDDMTINNSKGVTGTHDFTIEGVLNLESANASDTAGTLDMGANSLTMDSSATTIGAGDVTGIVKRLAFTANTAYSFGNRFTTITFVAGGTYPSQILVKIRIGTSPSWNTTAINRMYDLVQTGGNNCIGTIATHYLDSELNGNAENDLVEWTNGTPGPPPGLYEWGRTFFNATDNWVSIGNVDISYFSATFGQLENTLARSAIASYLWNGSQSSSWVTIENWTPNYAVSNLSKVIIPDASTTPNDPVVPASTEIKTLTIETGGIVNTVSDAQLTINGGSGAWTSAGGTFNYGNSNVIFVDPGATMAGTTNFFDVTIANGAGLTQGTGNIMRIADSLKLQGTGVINAALLPNTIEYNGTNQYVMSPNGLPLGYHNLILSGGGTKTMPVTALSVKGDFSMSGSASTTAGNALNITGNCTLGVGTSFETGAFSHSIGGNFSNNGAFTATGSTIICNGSSAQTISGTSATTFNNLTIDNAAGVTLASNALTIVSNTLLINSSKKLNVAPGKQLTTTGTITNNAGTSGFVLKSGSAGTASLLHNTDNVPATVERYISGDAEAWHFLSSPMTAQGISGTWLPSGTYGNGTGYDLYIWNEPTNCWIYKLNTTSVVNWNTVHPGSNFIPGRGYLYSVQATNPTKAFAGNLNNGSLTYPLTFSSADAILKGFNLVGNPYPSSVDWAAVSGWSRNDLLNSGGGYDMWIWNQAANNYGVYNSFTGTGTNSVTRYIAPMQGYFVRASGAGNLGLNNDVRVHNGASWFKDTETISSMVSVVVQSDADKSFDEALLLFGYSTNNQPGATKLFSNILTAPSLYMPYEAAFYSVRYLTDTVDNPTVPVMFKPGRDGNYTLSCNFEVDKFQIVMLEDRQMHYIRNLKTGNTYNFIASKTDDANRFVLHFGTDNTSSHNELPARVYSDGKKLVIDLSAVGTETTAMVYDALGRKLLHKTLQGSTIHMLSIPSPPQILIVQLLNQQGTITRKVFYANNK